MMGRINTNKAHKHFSYDAVNNISQCNLCKTSIKGNHGTNLKIHLIRHHEYKEDYFVEMSSNKCNKVHSILQREQKVKQICINEINTIKIKMTKKDLENSCVELVTVNGRPFSILNVSGFQNILNPIKCAIEDKSKQKFAISIESIQKKVFEEADKIRKEIYKDIKTL